MNFDHEELLLMMLYNTGTRQGLVRELLYIFGCGIYTVYRQTWDQFLILLVAEFLCFVLFVGATAMVEGVEKFSGWLRDLI